MYTNEAMPERNNDNPFIVFFCILFILMFVVFCPPIFGSNIEESSERYVANGVGLMDGKALEKSAVSIASKYRMSTFEHINYRNSKIRAINLAIILNGYTFLAATSEYQQSIIPNKKVLLVEQPPKNIPTMHLGNLFTDPAPLKLFVKSF